MAIPAAQIGLDVFRMAEGYEIRQIIDTHPGDGCPRIIESAKRLNRSCTGADRPMAGHAGRSGRQACMLPGSCRPKYVTKEVAVTWPRPREEMFCTTGDLCPPPPQPHSP